MDESLPELFLFTPGVKSLLFFCQVIFDFLKPTNKNTPDLLVSNSAQWGCGERGEVVSRQWPSACSAAAQLHTIKNRGWAHVPNIEKLDDSLKNVLFFE